MSFSKGKRSDNTTPRPGFFILEELEARGWAQSDLAFILGISVNALNPIITGRRSISTEFAKALGKAFDVPAEFFSNLQMAHEHSMTNEPDHGIEKRARLHERLPIREMVKRGWLLETSDSSELESRVAAFFKVNSVDEVPYLRHAAKKTTYEERNIDPAQLAWLFRVRQIAELIPAPRFDVKKLKFALGRMSELRIEPEGIRFVPQLLADSGVRFVLVEKLAQGKIDGVCFWSEGQPVIGMSLRFDRIDNFWFVLAHEIEHVLRGHGKKKEILDDLDGSRALQGLELPEEERIANAAASEFCVARSELKDFIARKQPYISERDVIGFASRLRIHPGLVVGQIHATTQNFRFLRKHLVKVREYLTRFAVSDGWGNLFPVLEQV